MFGQILFQVRRRAGLSQEKLAEAISVSRQAIQKWESGAAMPDLDNLTAIAEYFDISIDYLLRGKDLRDADAMRVGREILPSYGSTHSWDAYFKELSVEYRQCTDEGKNVAAFAKLFDAANSMPDSREKDEMADILFRLTEKAEQTAGFRYDEPSELGAIRRLSGPFPDSLRMPGKDAVADKIYGGWLGRICGCLLGKPVEGIRKDELDTVLRRTGNSPLHRYLIKEEMTPSAAEGLEFPIAERAYPADFGKMPADDDTNYTVLAHKIVEHSGHDFTSADVGAAWLRSQPKTAYCTAECVAYRNLVNGYQPPQSAQYKNPYREWIGAQIRGDYFGYINPCDPEQASDMAYRDASISHVKNGIYGEMWVSAMIACAFGCGSLPEIIRGGLAAVPETSRLYEAVAGVLSGFEKGVSCEDCMASIRSRWNEKDGYDWCHTISNAEIVTASLLYGKEDYGKTVCLAVSQGFDTDCNGATAGSVLGVKLGASAMPAAWTSRVGDTLETTIIGVGTVSIRGMAEKTLAHLK